MKKTIVLFLGLLLSAHCGAVTMLGAVPCTKWMKDRDEDGWAKVADSAWLVGYLTGIADSTGKNYLAGANMDAMEAAMDDYCHAHPLKTTYDGVWQKN